MENIFTDANSLARDMATGWFKFAEVGDKVGGVVRDMWEAEERDGYPAQRCFTLEQEGGGLINVGIKRTSFLVARTDQVQIGDLLGIRFEKEIPPSKKGFHPAKSLIVFTKQNGERRKGEQAKDLIPIANPLESQQIPEEGGGIEYPKDEEAKADKF